MSRRRWVFTRGGRPCEPYEVSEDWQPTFSTAKVELMTGSCYDGQRAQDGTDISSRQKHHEWMRQNNLADTSDFTETWKKAKRQRERVLSGEADRPQRREAIERALHAQRKP